MSLVTFGSTTYALDEFGFLDHPGSWDEDFVEGIAPSIGLGGDPGADHWRVIRYLRRKLEQENEVPFFVVACMDLGLKIDEFRRLFPSGFMRGACRAAGLSYETCQACNLTLKELGELFPTGYRRGACRIAGLPLTE